MIDLEEFRSYIGFGADDEERLRRIWPAIEAEQDAVVEDFYARVLAHPSTSRVLKSADVVDRLSVTLRGWLSELVNGPWDEAYVRRRERIGKVHVDVGVSHTAMFMGMNALRQALFDIAFRTQPDAGDCIAALLKVTELDLMLITGEFHNVLQSRRVRDVRALLVTHMPAIVLLLGLEGTVHAATPATEWMFDTTFHPGASFRELLPAPLVRAAQLERYMARALETGHEVTLPRIDVKIGDRHRHLSVTIVPFDDPDPGVIVHVEDHTVAVENERRLRQQESLAQIGTMSATLAHEIRNPLAGIGGALQVIAAGLPDDDRRAPIMTKILDQIRALNRLVTDLLSFARPDDAKVKDGIDLGELCRSVALPVQRDHPEVHVTIEGDGVAATDPDILRQILLNLVINGCQAAGSGGTLAVAVDGAMVRVSDSGPGLPESVRRRMFEPFYTTKLKGTGLGLPISQKLARAIDAELRVVDGCDLGGACFEVRLRSA